MSWHSGDWANFIVTMASSGAAVAAAYAAFQSAKITRQTLAFQKETSKFERERHLYELLRSDASKANESVKAVHSDEWTFSQAANVTYAIDSAKQRIKDESPHLTESGIKKFKEYFKDQLSHEITSEMHNGSAIPDAIFKPKGSTQETLEIIKLWRDNSAFFEYKLVPDEDLND